MCDHEREIIDNKYTCSICNINTNEPVFEIHKFDSSVKKTRYNKFMNLLLSKQLPYGPKYTLLDSFKIIENYFYISHRTNFINLEQLAIELLKLSGYSEYCNRFTSLKTKARVKQVSTFVRSAFGRRSSDDPSRGLSIGIRLMKLDEIDLIPLTVKGEINNSKLVKSEHIYH